MGDFSFTQEYRIRFIKTVCQYSWKSVNQYTNAVEYDFIYIDFNNYSLDITPRIES